MEVLQALFVKACFPISLILAVSWVHNSGVLIDNLVLCTLMAIPVAWVFTVMVKRMKPCRQESVQDMVDVLYLQAQILCCVLMFVICQNETHKTFLSDNAIPFICFRHVYGSAKQQICYILTFCYNFAKILKIPIIKILMYLLYLTIHSVIFIFLFDFLFTFLKSSSYIFLHKHHSYSLDKDFHTDYPPGFLNPVLMDTSLAPYSGFRTEIYGKDSMGRDTCPLDYGFCKRFLSLPQQYYPTLYRKVYRYKGEDIEMECSFEYINYSNLKPKFVWLFQQKPLQNSSRFRETVEITQSKQNKNVFDVKSTLKIMLLRESDFGIYECGTKTITFGNAIPIPIDYQLKCWPFLNPYYLFTTRQTAINTVYNITMLDTKAKLIYREVGNMIMSNKFFLYHTHSDIEDITVDYTVNGKAVEQVCPTYLRNTCSVLARMYWLLENKEFANPVLPHLLIHPDDTGRIAASIYLCLCPNMFGIHRVQFFRSVYLASRNRTITVEISHPFIFVILPAHPNVSLQVYQKDQSMYMQEIEQLVKETKYSNLLEEKVKKFIELYIISQAMWFTAKNIFDTYILLNTSIFLSVFLVFASKYYFKLFVSMPVRKYFFPPPLKGNKSDQRLENDVFDVFLSYSNNENDFAIDILLPLIENECNLKACLPDRDFYPGQHIYNMFEKNITTSRKIIVILSKAYKEENLCGNFQLDHIILPMLYENKDSKSKVLFIKYDNNCELPRPLRWSFEVGLLNWTSELPTKVKLQKIKTWLLTGHIS